jgi:predicted nuclease of predicted toxin-antitoxin system
VNFLIDAQLPRLLALNLQELGHQATHTLDLENSNRTSDQAISSYADSHDAVVVSKDRDFLDSHLINGSPARLLMVATGNISNHRLLSIFKNHIISIENAFAQANWVELNVEGLIIHS